MPSATPVLRRISPVRPKPRRSSPDAEDGRGLVLLDALAADWGSFYDPAGKVVWQDGRTPSRAARQGASSAWQEARHLIAKPSGQKGTAALTPVEGGVPGARPS
jgi:hypothetical protein